jgi:hypothetical protein
VTFEAEWAAIKQDAAVSMQLASSREPGMDGRGANGRVTWSKEAWTGAATGIGSVATQMKTAEGQFDTKQEGAGKGEAGGEGLASAAALASVTGSWKRKLNLVARECAELQDKCRKTSDAFYQTEQGIKAAFKEQKTQPVQGPHAGERGHG